VSSVEPAASDRLRHALAIAGVVLAVILPVIDATIVQIALPSIMRSLNLTRSGAVWVVNAYNVAILICLLPAAGLGDRFGYRTMCRAGVIIFTLASAACAFSTTLQQLVAARAVQGVGAACVMTTTNALMRVAYGPGRLGRAMGMHAMTVAVSSAMGPTLAAVVLWVAPWPALFLINLPAGALALWASSGLPKGRQQAYPFDFLAAGLCAGLFALLVAAADRASAGQGKVAWVAGLAAVPVAVALYRRSHGAERPLAPLDLLRHRVFSLSMLGSVCVFSAQSMALIALPFMIQQSGRSPSASGMIITVWPVCVGLSAFAAARRGEGSAAATAIAGAAIFAAGLVSLAFVSPTAGVPDWLWRVALCGLGFGLFQTPNNTVIFGSAPVERSGAAGGMLALARLTGLTAGAILLSSMVGRLGQHPWTVVMLAAAGACALACLAGSGRLNAVRSAPLTPSLP
jgi:DHA2 family multidrug resistance protein-like MFS transporter